MTQEMTFDIRALILQCSDCDRYWRAYKVERCIHCAREYGLPYFIDPLRRLALFEAVRSIPLNTVWPFPGATTEEDKENALQFAIALEDNCPWYDEKDPVCVQAAWLAIQQPCPWAHLDPAAQAAWDDVFGAQPIPAAPSQLAYASYYFDADFQSCADADLDEDPRERWAAHCDQKEKEKWEIYVEEQLDRYGL
jgi:hypothetical protein